MTPKQFATRFWSAFFLLLVVIGLFNRIIDPFWYYRDTEIEGLNKTKPKFRRYERHVKPDLLIREQPQAIILGSSFSEIGFDPTNPFFTDNGRLPSMNFAFAGASWELTQCSFEFAVKNAPIKRALLGFSPGSLPAANCEKDFATFGKIQVSELLFSIRAVDASIGTITRQKQEKPSHTKEGMYYYIRNLPNIDQQFKIFFAEHIKKNSHCLKSNDHDDSTADTSLDLSGLQRIIKIAQAHDIELVLYAYPSHAYSLELSQQCGEFNTRWQALQQIAKQAEQHAPHHVRIWHFYGYNDITAETIGSSSAKYWQDPEHFNFEMGDLMLEDMFSKADNKPGLGHPITSNSIAKDRQNYIQEHEAYLNAHPNFQTDFRSLLPY